MGKRLIQQARGKGGPTYRSPSFRYKGSARYPKDLKKLRGKVVDIIHCSGHTTPLINIKFENGEDGLTIAPEDIYVGKEIASGKNAKIETGNIVPLEGIPEGTLIYNIEKVPGDGGKFVRGSGAFARVIAKLNGAVIVQLPSKKQKRFNASCRASIGVCAGGGRTDKPFLKAGNRHYLMKARNKLYPRSSGVAMNSIDHPFGGSSSSHKGRPTQAPRNAPPGRKVGMIRPKRSGRRKG